MNAFILINTEPGKLWQVAEKVLKMDAIKIAHAVTGQFDVIVYVEFIRIKELQEIIREVRTLDGVERTATSIALALRLH